MFGLWDRMMTGTVLMITKKTLKQNKLYEHNHQRWPRSWYRPYDGRLFKDRENRSLSQNRWLLICALVIIELKGESAARLASYSVALSRANSAVFTVREITVKTLLKHEDSSLFESTVIHEMFHAADKQMLENSHKVFTAIQNDIAETCDIFDQREENANIALLRECRK